MDDADRADSFIESVIDDHVADAMRKAADIPVGIAGDCELCGDYFSRLVGGACGWCRDRFGLK